MTFLVACIEWFAIVPILRVNLTDDLLHGGEVDNRDAGRVLVTIGVATIVTFTGMLIGNAGNLRKGQCVRVQRNESVVRTLAAGAPSVVLIPQTLMLFGLARKSSPSMGTQVAVVAVVSLAICRVLVAAARRLQGT
jgi:hypothetical protein